MNRKQQIAHMLYKGILYTQMSQITDITEEMLLDGEVMFGEKLNRKLTEWLMITEEIRNDLEKTARKEFEAFED